MADTAAGFSDLGGAVSNLFGAIGSAKSASSYTEAATLADQQAQIAAQSTRIQETQQQRQIYQTVSAGEAVAAGNGLTTGGSAGDILRNSAQQGALAKQLTAAQGQITQTGYEQQAGAYRGMASAAKSSSEGGFLSSAISTIGAVAMFL